MKTFVFCGLSTSGKTMIVEALKGNEIKLPITQSIKDSIKKIGYLKKQVTTTDRVKRNGEIEGKDYYFVLTKTFEEKIENEEFFEHANVYGKNYGLTKKEMFDNLKSNSNYALIMDPQGVAKVKAAFPTNVVSIYLDVDIETVIRRLESERKESSDIIEIRSTDLQYFYDYKDRCDFVVNANNDINIVLKDVLEIMNNVLNEK